MKKPDNFNNLQETIRKICHSTTPELDERILGEAFAALDEAMQPKASIWQTICKSKISKLAVAAIIILCATIGAKLFFTTQSEIPLKELTKQTERPLTQPLFPEEQKIEQDLDAKAKVEDIKTKLNIELKQIMDMFAANDIDGLTAMLSDRSREIRLAAAIYLAKIGDEHAAETLNKLSSESADKELANMFSITASLIQKRLEEEKQAEIAKSDKKKAQQKSTFIPKGVLTGFITDSETGEPVIDANIIIASGKIYSTSTDANGFYFFKDIEEDSTYIIKVISKEYIGITELEKCPAVYLSKDSKEVKHFKLEKACMIDLLVINEANEPVSNVQIFVTKPAEKNTIIDTGFEQMTDEKGLLLLGGLMRGTFNLTAIHKSKDTYKDITGIQAYFAPERITVQLENPSVIEYKEIFLKKGAEIQGQIQSSDGLPQGDLIISVQPVWWDLTFSYQNYATDYDGSFKLENITADTYQIKLKVMEDSNDIYTFQAELPPKDELFIITVPQDVNIPDSNIPDSNLPDSNIPGPNTQELTNFEM